MLPTDLTVSAVVDKGGRFLMIEERSSGVIVVNQPGGHIDVGESPRQAAEREALEESGCQISVTSLLGVYLWIQPQTRQNFLRIVFLAELISEDPASRTDDAVHAVHWYSLSDIKSRKRDLRSPVVLLSVEDYLAGKRQPEALLANIMPVQQNVDKVLANAVLI